MNDELKMDWQDAEQYAADLMAKSRSLMRDHPILARQKLSVAYGAYVCTNNALMIGAVEGLLQRVVESDELEAVKRSGYDSARKLIVDVSESGSR